MPLLTLSEAAAFCESARRRGRRLVLTNGVFDLLHLGHVEYLERARGLGEALLVGVNGDASARQLKGPGRPFLPSGERAALVAALRSVDAAVIFEEPTAEALLGALRPDVYAKGGDYAGKFLPEAAAAAAAGAQIVFIQYLPDHSTTALIEKIGAAHRTR
jgi:rfaE bifunctional protein nucleotidyltransferase chain/domain